MDKLPVQSEQKRHWVTFYEACIPENTGQLKPVFPHIYRYCKGALKQCCT